MPLSNLEIEEAMAAGSITIRPFRPRHLGTVSYDVTLGREVAYYTFAQGEFMPYVLAEDETLWLMPGQRVLARTEEAVGGLPYATGAITTTMHAKSTLGRLGLQVCACAGYGDVGYVTPWVMELQNMSPGPLALPPRAVIAQIAFHRTGPIREGSDYRLTGSYTEGKEEWSLFKHGLPKAIRSVEASVEIQEKWS